MDNNLAKNKKPISIIKIIFLIIALLVVAFIVYFGFLVFKYKKGIEKGSFITKDMVQEYMNFESNKNSEVSRVEIESSSEPYVGSNKPIMTIVEFGDFYCSKSKKYYPILKEFVNENKDKVRLIYRDLPILDSDYSLALMADCANKQNKFWEMHDKLFDYQDESSMSQEVKDKIVSEIGLNKGMFDLCISRADYSVINKDLEISSELKLKATPTSFLNGNKAEGVLSKDVLKEFLYKVENQK